VIARIWHGWTTPGNADAYEALLREEVLPGIDRIDGARGAYVLRDPRGDEVEFVTITLWDSLDAVRAFAGDDYEVAVVPPAARELLARFEERSRHYETVVEPD
jgi:heme-degrading monooxygenase HmoA